MEVKGYSGVDGIEVKVSGVDKMEVRGREE